MKNVIIVTVMLLALLVSCMFFTGCGDGDADGNRDAGIEEEMNTDIEEEVDSGEAQDTGGVDDQDRGYVFDLKNGASFHYNEKELGKYGIEHTSGDFPLIVTDNSNGRLGLMGEDGEFITTCDMMASTDLATTDSGSAKTWQGKPEGILSMNMNTVS